MIQKKGPEAEFFHLLLALEECVDYNNIEKLMTYLTRNKSPQGNEMPLR